MNITDIQQFITHNVKFTPGISVSDTDISRAFGRISQRLDNPD